MGNEQHVYVLVTPCSLLSKKQFLSQDRPIRKRGLKRVPWNQRRKNTQNPSEMTRQPRRSPILRASIDAFSASFDAELSVLVPKLASLLVSGYVFASSPALYCFRRRRAFRCWPTSSCCLPCFSAATLSLVAVDRHWLRHVKFYDLSNLFG